MISANLISNPVLDLFLGVWEGDRLRDHQFWLRWWNIENQLLANGSEFVEIVRQRAEGMAAQLRSLGIEPKI